MRSSFQVIGDILIANAHGEVDHHRASKLRDEIDEAMIAFHCKNLIFDLEKVTFMDSSGIGVVLGRYNKILQKGGRFIITGCSEYIERILQMAGVFSVIEHRTFVEEAVEMLQCQEQIRLEVVE